MSNETQKNEMNETNSEMDVIGNLFRRCLLVREIQYADKNGGKFYPFL